MSNKTILLAAALLVGAPALAQAQSMPRHMQDQSGASEYAPGQRAKSSVSGQSANEFAPGQRAKSSVSGESARSFAPGQQAKEPHSTGTLQRKR